jgi:hypothetical protein
MPLRVNNNILNQKGTPAFFSDTFANRPAFGFAGRVFISIDTGQIFEDTGSAWTLIADAGVGGGTLASVTANGNTTATGIVITANGLSTNSVTDTSKTAGSVLFSGTAGLISQDNANLFWDDTLNRLGIGTATPTAPFDIHGAGTLVQLNGLTTNNAYIAFQNNNLTKWSLGNNYATSNSFILYNNNAGSVALLVNLTSNVLQLNANLAIKQATGFYQIAGYNGIACDSGGFFFNCSTANNAYLNFANLTGSRSYTFPDTNGTLALTSQITASQWTTSGSNIYYNTGSVGIGTTSPIGNLMLVSYDTNIATSSQQAYDYSKFRINTYNGSSVGLSIGNVNGNGTYIQTCYNQGTTAPLFINPFGANIMIGITTDNGYKLQVNGGIVAINDAIYTSNTANATTYGWANSGAGTLFLRNAGVANVGSFDMATGVYTPLSDINKKKDFEISTIGLNAILNLKPTLYRMIEEDNTEKHLGFIAQEVKEFIPQAYVESKDFIGLDYQAIVATLVKSIQELNEKLERNNIN